MSPVLLELELACPHSTTMSPYSDLAVVCLIWPCCTCRRCECPAVELVVPKAPLYGLRVHAHEFIIFFSTPSPLHVWLHVVFVVVMFWFFFSLEVYFLAAFGPLMGSHAIGHHSYTYIKGALLSGLQYGVRFLCEQFIF